MVSNPHPFATAILGWRAAFFDPNGHRSMIPEHPHRHCDYITAFGSAGFTVRQCFEPPLSSKQARQRAKKHRTDAFADALEGLPAVVVWDVERQ